MRVVGKLEWLRFKLMRLVACWLLLAGLFAARGNKPLPPRLSRFVCATLAKAEEAAGLLLWLSVSTLLPTRERLSFAQARAFSITHFGSRLTARTVTIPLLCKRLLALQTILLNLAKMARLLARALNARVGLAGAFDVRDCWLILLPRIDAPRLAPPFLPP